MKYELRTDQFCALANDAQWHTWLSVVAPDLFDKLKSHLKTSRSCRSNKEVMHIIRAELNKRNLSEKLINFLKRVFPVALRVVSNRLNKKKKPVVKMLEETNVGIFNKHGVFKSYKPHLLSFPHKKIIIDENGDSLMRRTRQFIKTKIYTDYIVIDNRAYIEYFESRFRKEAEELRFQNREIYQYKKKNKI